MEEGAVRPGTEAPAGDMVSPGRWRLAVDASRCQGTGMCAAIAPDHFRLDGATSSPIAGLVEPCEAVLDAVESCPTEAIAVFDEAGRQVPATAGGR